MTDFYLCELKYEAVSENLFKVAMKSRELKELSGINKHPSMNIVTLSHNFLKFILSDIAEMHELKK